MRILLLLSISICLGFLVPAGNEIDFVEAWVRAVPRVSKVSAGFGIIHNNSTRERKLIRVESPISEHVELHNHLHQNGVMKMRAVEFIKVNKKSSKALKRKSYHIMFIGLNRILSPEDKIPLTLVFDNGFRLKKEVEVRKK